MRNKELEEAFRRGVDAYLKAGLHERRGLTADQYMALCRRLWDACPTSDEYPSKIIVDRRATLPELVQGAELAYDDLRIRDCVDLYRVDADLYCISVGLFREDGTPVSFDETTKPSFADPPEWRDKWENGDKTNANEQMESPIRRLLSSEKNFPQQKITDFLYYRTK